MSRLPSLTPRKVVAVLKRAGFIEHHQTGSHVYLFHSTRHRMTSVAMHNTDLPRPTLKEIIKQAGFTEDEFRKFI